jgi:hypothetical protein
VLNGRASLALFCQRWASRCFRMFGFATQLTEGAQLLAATLVVKSQRAVSPRFFAFQQVV